MLAGVLFMAVCLELPGAASAKEPPAVVYKGPRPQKTSDEYRIDLKRLPDPFLSYFIRREQLASEEAEAAKQKQQAEEARLERKKREARQRLEDLKKPRTELQTLGLSQLTLTAIIQSKTGNWAMVRDPKGMGYILKEGTRIGTNGGVVSRIAINEKKVVIKEPYIDKEIHIKYKPVEMELPDDLY